MTQSLEEIINKKSNKKIVNQNKQQQYEYISENNVHKIIIKKEDNPILIAEYKLLGVYNVYNSVWYYGFNVALAAMANKNTIIDKSKLLEYNTNLLFNMGKYSDMDYVEYVNYMTSNDNFYVSLNKIDLVKKLGVLIYNADSVICTCDSINKVTCLDKQDFAKEGIKRLEFILLFNTVYY
jgi:hypothetical protein